ATLATPRPIAHEGSPDALAEAREVGQPAPSPMILQHLGREYGKGIAAELGKRTATGIWWIVIVVILAIAAAIPNTRQPVLKWIRQLLTTVAHSDSTR